MQKGNTLIFLLIGMLVLAGGAFYLARHTTPKSSPIPVATSQLTSALTPATPSPAPTTTDETANWKTYTNEQYGISFKYPNTVTIKDMPIGTTLFVHEISFCLQSQSNNCSQFFIQIFTNDKNLALDEYAKNGTNSPLGAVNCYLNDKRTTIQDTQFQDIPAIKYRYQFDGIMKNGACKNTLLDGSGYYNGILTLVGNYIFDININSSTADVPSDINQILSTFKFTLIKS